MSRRPSRKCKKKATKEVDASHYVGYVEDGETVDMIMKKFEELAKFERENAKKREIELQEYNQKKGTKSGKCEMDDSDDDDDMIDNNEHKNDIELQITGENNNNDHFTKLNNKLKELFGNDNVILLEKYVNIIRYQIGNENETIANCFEYIESIKDELNIINYSISVTSLEQIFVRFAKKQHELDTNTDNDNEWNRNRKCFEKAVACCLAACVVD
mmetsp:Transcript_54726/g.67128  ORF Transcript_54726/g.67128 Transcript_54726/m.67128 type:complete len:215 (+) Transcript_54726:85-729(+)